MVNPEPLTPAQINQLFGATPQPPDGTFELALVLGGTVSAGAYTAGVLDFLFEALEEWTSQKSNPETPQHKVIIRFITGTSGGGVNAAIAARALAYNFPHVVRSTPNPDKGTGNPFYDIWVNNISLTNLLATDDIVNSSVNSVLNGLPLDKAAQFIENYSAEPAPPRPYIADPLGVILTVTNMRGVPYRLDMGNGGQSYIDHADHARFAFIYGTGTSYTPRPDEFALGFDTARLPQAIGWPTFGTFALATSAFPIGLPARNLARPYNHYQYRVTAIPADVPGAPAVVKQLIVDWNSLVAGGTTDISGDYHFFAVDGGVTDNEPIELARTALAGYDGRNPRDGLNAKRAVLLIDPFAGEADLGSDQSQGLFLNALTLGQVLPQQTRYDTQDILLALDNNVFSRFMISAQRAGLFGGAAIASSGLDAFLGFACQAFRRHDYLLGRANCQAFLRSEFVLPAGAKALNTGPSNAPLTTSAFLPIIPLVGAAAVTETPAPWPKGELDPEIYRGDIEKRFKALVDAGLSGGLGKKFAAWFLNEFADGSVADFVIGKMKQALTDLNL